VHRHSPGKFETWYPPAPTGHASTSILQSAHHTHTFHGGSRRNATLLVPVKDGSENYTMVKGPIGVTNPAHAYITCLTLVHAGLTLVHAGLTLVHAGSRLFNPCSRWFNPCSRLYNPCPRPYNPCPHQYNPFPHLYNPCLYTFRVWHSRHIYKRARRVLKCFGLGVMG
jgi:hypothetical protein